MTAADFDRDLSGLTSLEKILAWMQTNDLPLDRHAQLCGSRVFQ